MSRIGNQPVPLPKGVDFKLDGDAVHVKGPKGQLQMNVAEGVAFEPTAEVVVVTRASDSQRHKANHGLMRALLANMVHGVTQGFQRDLEIIGVGYKADVRGSELVLNLGFSHPVHYPFPDGITITVNGPNKMSVFGIDKEKVGQVAAELRGFRPPDSYKGKGVRYAGEYVRLKAGKSGQ